MSEKLQQVEPEYVYVTVPAEYICVYHRILAMLADYGEDMLKDCKAACKDRNSGVIECFNMFNAAVAARKLGKSKLAETLIKYIKAKINQIYKGKDNSTSFVFPVDETGQLKAYVTCGERPMFEINPDDMQLYEHKFDNGTSEHFYLGEEDESPDDISMTGELIPRFDSDKFGNVIACANFNVYVDGSLLENAESLARYYFDGIPVVRFNDVTNISAGEHTFTVVVTYNKKQLVLEEKLSYAYS